MLTFCLAYYVLRLRLLAVCRRTITTSDLDTTESSPSLWVAVFERQDSAKSLRKKLLALRLRWNGFLRTL